MRIIIKIALVVLLAILLDHEMDRDARALCAQGDYVSEDVCRQGN